jgi:hypothetical protein
MSSRRLTQLIALGLMVAQGLSLLGLPTLARPSSAVAYPCRGHQCGCATAELCWAGDCCCFTLEEKVAWAEREGVEPPEFVSSLLQYRKVTPKPKSCCSAKAKTCCTEDEPLTVEFVLTIQARKCRGQGPGETLTLDPCVIPTWLTAPMPLAMPKAFPKPVSLQPDGLRQSPPSPPPKV